MATNEDQLNGIDRWYSVPLDVHKWTDHPEIKALSDRLYYECGINTFDEASGNRKPKRKAKDMLRILLLDLYVNWLKDPNLAISISKRKEDYKVKDNRYNQLHISHRIIDVNRSLVEHFYIEELPYYHDHTGKGESYQTRIRHTSKLRDEFRTLTVDLYDIDFDVGREVIILREKFTDEEGDKKRRNLHYEDDEYTNTIREQLRAYNDLLKVTFIDIPTLSEPFIRRKITKGKRAGQEQLISIGPDNKHVHRVFNGTADDNWTKGGRFYGGWWQQIPKEMRPDIYINDIPTVEVDYQALHPNLLLLEEESEKSTTDPYTLDTLVLPDLIKDYDTQRAYVKKLVLMAINADSEQSAFSAFRSDSEQRTTAKRLTNEQLRTLLNAFTDKFPQLKESLNTGQALRLMALDSKIANMVLAYFTEQQVAVLCMHDSFIIQYNKENG